MDQCAISAGVFHKHADVYRGKYMDLTLYDRYYGAFCSLLPTRRAQVRVLDAACGPGNVARYLMAQRPDLALLGMDLAPRMVELAREAVPLARFMVYDCRRLADLQQRFDGIMCAFGLPYLSGEEAAAFIRTAGERLDSGGVLFLSTMLGRSEDSGLQVCSTGDPIYIHYHAEDAILGWLRVCGFSVLERHRLASPSNASKQTADLILIARLGGAAEDGRKQGGVSEGVRE